MFSGARSFNQPLNKWNVSNVTYMESMFGDARSFNQPLNKLTVRGTQTLVSFAPLAFKLFYAARQNAVLRRLDTFQLLSGWLKSSQF